MKKIAPHGVALVSSLSYPFLIPLFIVNVVSVAVLVCHERIVGVHASRRAIDATIVLDNASHGFVFFGPWRHVAPIAVDSLELSEEAAFTARSHFVDQETHCVDVTMGARQIEKSFVAGMKVDVLSVRSDYIAQESEAGASTTVGDEALCQVLQIVSAGSL